MDGFVQVTSGASRRRVFLGGEPSRRGNHRQEDPDESCGREADICHEDPMSLIPKGVRKGQAPSALGRDEFSRRYLRMFVDPAFDGERAAISRLEEIAYSAYIEGRKAPSRQKAGPEFEDPNYELST